MKTLSRKELVKKLRKLGFEGPFSGGKHQFMVKRDLKLRIPNPHGPENITYPLLREILRQGDISVKEWDKN